MCELRRSSSSTSGLLVLRAAMAASKKKAAFSAVGARSSLWFWSCRGKGGGGERVRTGLRRAKETIKRRRERTDVKRILKREDTQRRGKATNWTQACNSCPLDSVSGAIKTADMHMEGGGLGAVMAEQRFSEHGCDDRGSGWLRDCRGNEVGRNVRAGP